jgi:hypothetical protein
MALASWSHQQILIQYLHSLVLECDPSHLLLRPLFIDSWSAPSFRCDCPAKSHLSLANLCSACYSGTYDLYFFVILFMRYVILREPKDLCSARREILRADRHKALSLQDDS